jgi:hypothetical protein
LLVGGGGDVEVSVVVALTEQLGDETFIYGTMPNGETLVIRAPGQNPVRHGATVEDRAATPACHLFGADEKRLTPTARKDVQDGRDPLRPRRLRTPLEDLPRRARRAVRDRRACRRPVHSNPGRAEMARARVAARFPDVACYHSDHFDRMLGERSPDCLLIMVPDLLHEQYICRALESGCDVIVEKPMAIDGSSCVRIADTERRTGKHVTVTMNYRFSPVRTLLKEVLMSGLVGAIKSVQFEWRLDTYHGADYYRRWHRRIANAGSLFVHKASHHFDLVNWWLGALPTRVYAKGTRQFYRPETADALGLIPRGERCTGCPALARCNFAWT